jgi:hypothetical protein
MKTQYLRIAAALSIPFALASATVALAAYLSVAPLRHDVRHGPGVVTILNDVPTTAQFASPSADRG